VRSDLRGTALLAVAALVLLTASPAVAATTSPGVWPTAKLRGSWALGVVVPDGARLADGSSLSWTAVSNISVVARLPNITQTDDTVYAIVSAKLAPDVILQVAAGLYPGDPAWSGYVLMVQGSSTASQTYVWVTNASEPFMAPEALVGLSLYRQGGGWRWRVTDYDTGLVGDGPIPNASGGGFVAGDQEVFALESYTSSRDVFSSMGAMDVYGIYLDGRAVAGGYYSLGGWDPLHNPLFIVGGYEPPSFISVADGGSTWRWSYSAEGRVSYVETSSLNLLGLAVVTALIVVGVLALNMWLKRKGRA
jgi:hypothetical protein